MSLTRSSMVMDYISDGADGVLFAQPDMEVTSWLDMAREKWEEFGRPKKITVTVQPGDLLNGPGEVTGVDVPDGQLMIPLTEILRPVLLHHHPMQRTKGGPLTGCYCGAVRLGEDVIEHVAAEVAKALEPAVIVDDTDHEDWVPLDEFPPGQGPLNG